MDTLPKNHEVAEAPQISNIKYHELAEVPGPVPSTKYQISNILRWLRYLAQVQLLDPDKVGEDTSSELLYEVLSQ